jgi:hypothetical protein
LDRLVDFGLPGIVFVVLLVWLVRKVFGAARTERDLEGERFTGVFADELTHAKQRAADALAGKPHDDEVARLVSSAVQLVVEPMTPLTNADTRGASQKHLKLVEAAALERELALRKAETSASDVPRRVEILWVRSTNTHAVWCERRLPATRAAIAMAKDVICVALIEGGRIVDRWSY